VLTYTVNIIIRIQAHRDAFIEVQNFGTFKFVWSSEE